MLGFQGFLCLCVCFTRSLLIGGFMTVDGWVGLVHRLLHFRKAAREQASRHTKASFKGALSRSPIYPQIFIKVLPHITNYSSVS